MKKILLLIIISLTISSYAQDGSIDNSFNPQMGATNGVVKSTIIQPDGKILLAGDFTVYNGITNNRIVRLNSNGTIDTTFTIGSGFNNTVNFINIQQDGKIIVVGNFSGYNGITKNRIVRLNIDGTIDSTFNIGTGSSLNVYSTTIQSDGKIIVVGDFTSLNGISANRFARLNTDGTIDTSFNVGTGANGSIYTCATQTDGKTILAGAFTSFNGTTNKKIVRLNIDGSLDATFNSTTSINLGIHTMGLQSDGKIIIGGSFTSFGTTSAKYIARLNSNGTLDTTFNSGTGFNSAVFSIALQADGKPIIGGNFYSYNDTVSTGTIRLNLDGTIDSTFTGTNSIAHSIAIQSNGKIILGGNFSNCAGFLRNNLARINENGSIDTSFFPFFENGISSNGGIRDIAFQSDGKIIIAGEFSTYNGISINKIARLNTDGTLDYTFNIGTGVNGWIQKIEVLSDNKIIIVGAFTSYNGIIRNRIARLNSDGTIDSSFNSSGSGADNTILSVSIQTNGKIIIGGNFYTYNGTSRNQLARLNANGTLDTTFDAGTHISGTVSSTAIQSDGKIIIGGLGQLGNIARLNTNGTMDTTFNIGGTGPDFFVYGIKIQTDGKIIIGGTFQNYNNVYVHGLTRLNSNGSIDTTFNHDSSQPGTGDIAIQNDGKIIISGARRLNVDGTFDATFNNVYNYDTYCLAIQNDGKILVGGFFTTFNGVEKNYLLRLNNSNTLSSENFNNETIINIYPNPVSDYFRFNIPNDVNALGYEIYDLTGKKVDSDILKTNFINVKNYSNGIYLLHLNTDKGVLISKFIKN